VFSLAGETEVEGRASVVLNHELTMAGTVCAGGCAGSGGPGRGPPPTMVVEAAAMASHACWRADVVNCVSMPPAVSMRPSAGDDFGGDADDHVGMHAGHHIRISAFPIA